MLGTPLGLALYLIASASATAAQQGDTVRLGRLQTGATVSFVRGAGGTWGIEIAGGTAPRIVQPKPARLEVYRADGDMRDLAAGYGTVQRADGGIAANADVAYGDRVVFHVRDRWSLNGAVLSVRRSVAVDGAAPGGFGSSVVLTVDSAVHWPDVRYLAPGAIYGDPTYDGERSPGGTLNYEAHRLVMREDILPAPLFALSFRNGASVAVLDPAPRGASTVEETRLATPVMTDARFTFGALGAWQVGDGPIELGFRFPGTTTVYAGGPNAATTPRWIRRYHPIAPGTDHTYQVRFRFGRDESFRALMRNAWRWAWDTLQPRVTYVDLDLLRRVLTDHLAAQAATIDGRTGIPFVLSTVPVAQRQWNWTMIAMGFVGKDLECADQLLQEADRDSTERGRNMRRLGLAIISSMIRALPTVPMQATGFDLRTGKPWEPAHIWLAPWLRNGSEGRRTVLEAYRRERALGREHPEWLAWVRTYADWLIRQQRADGSFPRRWQPGSDSVAEATGTTSYAPVPLLILLTRQTGDPKYQRAAARAADFVWASWGARGLFVGGASDNPNITDKEAGMLSLDAYLSLYQATRQPKWLERARAAADFAESWIWIWNLPMPLDADNAQLHWKQGVPTVGVQGITALNTGSVDEYLDWAVPCYARLYEYTRDPHYLDVARVLLHDTKSMVALPGRQYDMIGIGWQQEGWRMGPGPNGRGVGGHRFWLPWISANHLHGITGLEKLDPALYRQLARPKT